MNKEERIAYEEFMIMFKNAPKLAYMLYDKAEDEIERLNNIINELEKFFKYEFDNEVRPLGSYKVSVWTICLDKLKELKENKNEIEKLGY